MDFPRRLGQGLRLYVVLLGSALLLAGVWWVNGSLLANTTEETGWAVMVGIVVVTVVAAWIVKRLRAASDEDSYEPHDEPYDWQS